MAEQPGPVEQQPVPAPQPPPAAPLLRPGYTTYAAIMRDDYYGDLFR